MSKGIGESYVKRMKRYHVPRNVRDVNKRIELVCDRAFYHDGAFKYKLPRYYRDRLYRKKYPCESQVWNPKFKIYETKIVKRYLSKNLLSLQMQAEIRKRILAEYNKRFDLFKSQYPNLTDTEIYIALARSEKSARVDRQKSLLSKSARFYNSQRFKNRDF